MMIDEYSNSDTMREKDAIVYPVPVLLATTLKVRFSLYFGLLLPL
jgi:hypothetical protein